jgi:hypothetical protein
MLLGDFIAIACVATLVGIVARAVALKRRRERDAKSLGIGGRGARKNS